MSNVIRYDSFLVQHLARELHEELAGKGVTAVQFDATEQRILIDAEDVRLVWDLHPTSGVIARVPPLYPLPDSAILPRRARVQSVTAIPDERILAIHLTGERKDNATVQVVVELLTNQWNAFALDHAGRVLRVLKVRAAGRAFRRGQLYAPPEPRAEESRSAYASPLNAALSAEAFARMLADTPAPAIITTEAGAQPYPHHLWQEQAQRFPSLLAAFVALGGDQPRAAVVRDLERRVRAGEKKIERLRSEMSKAEAAARTTRANGDLLLAYATTVTRGVSRVVLPGFDGHDVAIDLDPRLSAVANAEALYAEARKQERAVKTIPGLLTQAERQLDRSLGLLERARSGDLTTVDLQTIASQPAEKPKPGQRLPYRRYRTSGGMEVRVGRNAKSNDELTLHHSSPRDIWMHARHVGGAHVVLRWADADANPPQQDLIEAAILAAVHSAARTSKTVPVDYTRRKYVRKPRRSPPGTVVMERAKTVFVEPDPEVEQRLRQA